MNLDWLCNILGFILKALYDLVQNYGVAIILFSVIFKLALLPLTISQQRTTEKTAKLQDKMKEIQDRYKNDPEKANEAIMKIYKEEKINPLGGCFSAIIQIILIFAMFYLVKSPLTFMLKLPEEQINAYVEELKQEGTNIKENDAYKEIYIIKSGKLSTENNINMNFLGINLSDIPKENFNDIKVLIIPALYVLTSFLSLRYSTAQLNKKKKETEKTNDNKTDKENSLEDTMQMNNKMMSLMMPLLSVSIAIIAPLRISIILVS